MNKVLLSIVFAASVATSVFGAVAAKTLKYAAVDSTSGGVTITANMAAVSGSKVSVYAIYAKSDLSTSTVQIQRANATGSTTNYTTVFRYDVGATTNEKKNGDTPVFVGDASYAYRLLLNCTTANSLISVYTYE